MVAQVVQSLKATIAKDLWTWGGVYFGFRRQNSLFTHDGIEVGRFSGLEVYAPDGRYLGELGSTEDGDDRLVTSSYKQSLTRPAFVPVSERPHAKIPNREAEPLYCGYEHFPTLESARRIVLE